VRDLLARPVRPARLLATFPTAAYVRLAGGEVVAVLTHDALRLPCGLVLAASSRHRPLGALSGTVLAGAGQLRVGTLVAQVSRLVSFAAPTGLRPDDGALEHAAATLARAGFREHGPDLFARLAAGVRDPVAARRVTAALLGAGSGLTPSGDDVLAGLLVGAACFGLSSGPIRTEVRRQAAAGTTDLSATLLAHAARGEALPQVSRLLRALADPDRFDVDRALADLTGVGQSSGAALATGVLAAARIVTAPDRGGTGGRRHGGGGRRTTAVDAGKHRNIVIGDCRY
jgi:hypothetical protein